MSDYLIDLPCKGRNYFYKPAWTHTQLLEIAKELQIRGRHRMTKADLCGAIQKDKAYSRVTLKKAIDLQKKYGKRAMSKRFCERNKSKKKCGEYSVICRSKRIAGKRKGTTRHYCGHNEAKRPDDEKTARLYFELLREAEMKRMMKKSKKSKTRSPKSASFDFPGGGGGRLQG